MLRNMKRLVPAALAVIFFGLITLGAVALPRPQSQSSNAPVNVSGLPVKVASGATALHTALIATTACDVTTATATGTLTTDSFQVNFNADPTAVTGYVPATTGGLTIYMYVTANTVNFKVCNPTSGSITPGAVTLNWLVER